MRNPFEYEAANNLSEEDILDYYIEDHNFSRFIISPRNIFLTGERGTGKTMTLLYYSAKIEYLKSKKEKREFDFHNIGIHIPCKTPLIYKQEYELLNDFKAYLVSEHYLTLYIANELVTSLHAIREIENAFIKHNLKLKNDFEYLTGEALPSEKSFLESISIFSHREVIKTQRKINSPDFDEFYNNTYSLNSLILPLLEMIKSVPFMGNAHFMFMLDDAHDLNSFQKKIVNSWIAYRDHSNYSFKVAITSEKEYHFTTASGGSIIEDHDFTKVEKENPFRNSRSDFGKMAKDIIERRLSLYNINISAEHFFPTNPSMIKGLEEAKEIVRKEYLTKNPSASQKQVSDYVYKYHRAYYFGQRHSKANLPPYSGLEIIVQLSTGVIRNLLAPCHEMFEMVLSNQQINNSNIKEISPTIQTEAIKSISKRKWESIEHLHRNIEGCSENDKNYILNMFNNLMTLFRDRLQSNLSEPRAIKFIITEHKSEAMRKLEHLLLIAQKAQLLYMRTGRSKDDGKHTSYYEPNRLLLPDRGLDPIGQHSEISIKSTDLWAAASKNKRLKEATQLLQPPTLFDDYD
ncbi:hypothetical protein FHS57_002917 [Runella defluvii]|uniref:Uncharacterized protein n=1 Tax=Runella defluvii TaxID=370973 RepID=A0A7W5ZKU4_9BACT|nr:hypothetical protein [Runella defluvii]MBB3838911.1 hypothetical protein [Runella defluvii]